jgi:hypothetical protein
VRASVLNSDVRRQMDGLKENYTDSLQNIVCCLIGRGTVAAAYHRLLALLAALGDGASDDAAASSAAISYIRSNRNPGTGIPAITSRALAAILLNTIAGNGSVFSSGRR